MEVITCEKASFSSEFSEGVLPYASDAARIDLTMLNESGVVQFYLG
jgi:hypothetical protein